jgi:hypothetical protein
MQGYMQGSKLCSVQGSRNTLQFGVDDGYGSCGSGGTITLSCK